MAGRKISDAVEARRFVMAARRRGQSIGEWVGSRARHRRAVAAGVEDDVRAREGSSKPKRRRPSRASKPRALVELVPKPVLVPKPQLRRLARSTFSSTTGRGWNSAMTSRMPRSAACFWCFAHPEPAAGGPRLLAVEPIDMRGSFDALAGAVRRLGLDPVDGHLSPARGWRRTERVEESYS